MVVAASRLALGGAEFRDLRSSTDSSLRIPDVAAALQRNQTKKKKTAHVEKGK